MGDFSFLLVFVGDPTLEGVPAGLKHGDAAMVPVVVRDCGDLMKAAGAIPPGARWITVHPNGHDAKGVPVLVQEQKKGSGVWHVIGGAGGKLNYLKIRGVRSEGEYKQDIAQRQKEKREANKAAKARDKELGLDKAKKEARENVSRQVVEGEKAHIREVADAMGWDKKDMDFDEDAHSHLSEAARNKARSAHHRDLLRRASDAIDMQRKRLVADEDARRSAELGEIPLESASDDQLSVEDLVSTKLPDGAGFSPAFAERAKANGLTDEELRSELDSLRESQSAGLTEAQRNAAIKRGETAQMVREELAKVQADKPDLKAKLVEAQKAVALLKSEKKLKALKKTAREASKEIDSSAVEPKAYVLQADEATDADIAREVEDELRTMKTRSFLAEVGKLDPSGDALAGHVATGAFNSINSLSLAAAGASLLDRSAVDVLGVAGAAQVIARKLRSSLGADADRLAEGLEEFHTQHYMRLSQDALREAQDLQETARELSLGEAEHAGDLVAAAAIHRQKKEALAAAAKVLGQSLGEMEANAALVMALKEKGRDSLQVSLGRTRPEDAIRQARALGLQPGDYKLDQAGGNMLLTVHGSGMDRIAGEADPENAARVRRNLDIMEGKHDEADWLPQGFARRPDLAMDLKPGVAPSLAAPMDFGAADTEAALRDYIGGRMADGDRPADILADIQSADFFTRSGDTDAYRKALDAVAPNKDGEKGLQRVERLEEVFQGYADDFVARRHGPGVASLNRQNFEADAIAQDAAHRALSDEPAGVAAYKPIGELTNQDQKALRDYFYKHIAKESDEGAALRAEFERLGESEPDRTVTDMFGEETENPDWRSWQSSRNELAEKLNASSLNWPKYVAMMRGNENAYAAMQDVIRSNVAENFAGHYNRLNPEKPLKLGRGLIRGNLNHLDAVDPSAREARLAQERELVDSLRERDGGRYASGRVADKLDAARDAKEAAAQAQMGFFAGDDMFGGGDLFGHEEPAKKPLGADERHTLGHAAERTLAGLVQTVGRNFKPGQPVKLFQPTMSGPSGAARQRAIKHLEQNKRTVLGFGVGCVRGDTVLDDVDGTGLTFAEWWLSGKAPRVFSLNNKGEVCTSQASSVFIKGVARCREIVLSDGSKITASDDHLFLTKRGWIRSTDVSPGDVFLRPSFVQREASRQFLGDEGCVLQRSEIAVDCQCCCSICYGRCDEQLLCPEEGGLNDSPLQGDAHIHTLLHLPKDGQAPLCKCTQKDVSKSRLSIEENFHLSRQVDSLELGLQPDEVALGLLRDLSQESWLSDGRFDSLRSTCEQYLQRSNHSPWGRISSSLHECRHGINSCEQSQSKCQAPSLSLMRFEEPDSVELQHQGGVLAALPLECSCVVSVGVSGLYFVFDLNVPVHANYYSCGMVHHNSGKTAIGLGAFTDLHEKGLAKKGVFIVPSIVQGQFGAEALRFLEPGKFNWHCEPGGARDGRLKAYKDAGTHFVVATHQSFRDDLLHMAATQEGGTPEAIADKLDGMSKADRAAYVKGVLEKEGIAFDYVMADEAHGLLNRDGKENSRMANVIEGVTDNAERFLFASGDPIKNDASEAFDLLSKMDGKRYSDKAAFMRRYGGDTKAAKDGLRRELARHLYADSITPDVKADKREIRVPMADGQKAALSEVTRHVANARIAKMEGRVDVDAMRALVPQAFEGVDAGQHEAVARGLSDSLGIVKSSAVRRILDNHPQGGKVSEVLRLASERKGKPGVVFAHSLEAVESLKSRLEAEGHRVVTITGKDSAKDKASKIQAFNPDKGDRSADIVIASDAGATGANLQSGQWLVQFDTPNTAMVHAQRRGRIHRIGQKNDIELLDLVADHPEEDKARKRLRDKYALRDLVTSPLDGLDDTGVAGFLRQRHVEQEQGGLF